MVVTAWRRAFGYFLSVFEPRPWGRWTWLFLAAWLAPTAYGLAEPLYKAWRRGWPDLVTALLLSAVLVAITVLIFWVFRWLALEGFTRPLSTLARAGSRKRRSRRSRRRQR